jgi:hypothetical protein
MAGVRVENFDGLAPGRGLGRADLTQIYPDSAEIRKNRLPTAVEAILLDR